MAVRALTADDAGAVERLVLLASFPPGGAPDDASESAHVRRWLRGWPGPHDLGAGHEEGGRLVGAAVARVVEPVRLAGATGAPVPEVLVAVEDGHQGQGIGAGLVAALVEAARHERWPALALTVSERNPAAVSLYRGAGFTEAGHADRLLVMQLRLDG